MIILTSISGYFNKEELDVFFASFRIPDLIFEILITGALTSTFIPIYLKYKDNKEELSKNISSIINLIMIFLTFFVVIISIFLDKLIPILTPGYDVLKMEKIINFSRLLLLGQLPFFVMGNFLTGIGQANKTFFLSALAPIIYNLSIIIATVFFFQTLSLEAPIWGVIIGAIFLFLIQIPLLFSFDFSYRLILKKTKGLIEFIKLVIPRALTVIVAQIDATIDLSLATLLGGGAYTVFYLAQHLSYFSIALPFHSIYYLLTRSFYAIMDSKTPFFVSITAIFVNTILSLSFVFIFHLPVWSLAISFSISIIVNSIILFFILWKKISGFNLMYILVELVKIMLAGFFAAFISYFLLKLFDGLILDTSRTINVFFLLVIIGLIFSSLYLFIAWIIDLKEIYLLSRLITKAQQLQKKITGVFIPYE